MMRRAILIVVVMILSVTYAFGKIDKVFIIPFSHLDIGFTKTQEEVSKEYVEMINSLLNMMDIFPDFSFTIETFWQLEQWLETSPEPFEIQKLVQYVKDGRLEIAGAYASMHTGFMNKLSLSETFNDSIRFAKENNFVITTALMNDVPGYVQDLPDALSESGIPYFMSGINDKYGDVLQLPGLVNIFYWEGPNHGKVLTWITKASYMEGITFKSISSIESYVERLEEEGYPYDAVAIMVATDNGGLGPGLVSYLNLHEGPLLSELQIEFSTPSKFFKRMEEKYGDVLPVYRGDWSGFWESVKTGGPYSSSLIRWSQEILQELTSSNMINPEDPLYRTAIKNILLYSEHGGAPGAGWPGNYTLEQTHIFNKTVTDYASTAYSSVRGLLDELVPEKTEPSKLYVFNPGNSETGSLLKFEIAEWNPNIGILLEFEGKEYTAYPFTSTYTDPWNQIDKGYEVYMKLPKGNSEIVIKGITDIKREESKDRENDQIVENGFYRIVIKSDGTFDIFDKDLKTWVAKDVGTFEHAYTSSIEVREKERLAIRAYESYENPQQKSVQVKIDSSPIVELDIALPSNEKKIFFSYFIDQTKIPYIPYENHSINYFLKIPISSGGKFVYRGPDSIVKDPYEFPALRPGQVAVRDLFALESDGLTVTMGTRQAFMVGFDSKTNSFDCLLLRHYDETATKDSGIVRLENVEPGSPDVLTFSFFFTTGREIDLEGAENFMRPPIALTQADAK
ncbi:MAG TPA: hypothetical protein PKV93_05020 [Fervidobacterium sp.]|nr:hypothetical protein [Fervidobacterium sp.]